MVGKWVRQRRWNDRRKWGHWCLAVRSIGGRDVRTLCDRMQMPEQTSDAPATGELCAECARIAAQLGPAAEFAAARTAAVSNAENG